MKNINKICIALLCLGTVSVAVADEEVLYSTEGYCVLSNEGVDKRMLDAYAKKLGIKTKNWQFLWGTRDEIYALAERNYMVYTKEEAQAPGGFAHQGYLILVDKHKRIRGAYDGTVDEDVAKLMTDMDILLKEN